MSIASASFGAAVALVVVSGCGDKPVPFEIRLELADGCGSTTDCADYGMACGASLGVRILDAEAMLQPDGGRTSPALAEKCVWVEPGEELSLCDLGSVAVDFRDIPTRRVQIQVAVWNPDDLDDPLDCPSNLFSPLGALYELSPQPAFAGAAYFAIGSEPVVQVPLSCRNPAHLNAAECLPATQEVTATLDDMNTNLVVSDAQAAVLDVSVAEPHQPSEEEWVIERGDEQSLDLVSSGSSPYWAGSDLPGFTSTACVLAQNTSELQPVTSVACTDQIPADPVGTLALSGWVLPKEVLDQILAAAAMSVFPEQGLVVGRVVDDSGNPLAGVVVSAANATIEYVSEDRTTTDGITETSTDAFFISRDAEYNTRFTAIQPDDGREEDGEYRAGLIVGKVSVVTIKMSELATATAR